MKITRHNLRKMILESMRGGSGYTNTPGPGGRSRSKEESAMVDQKIAHAMATIKRELQNFYMTEGIMNTLDQQLSVHYGGIASARSALIEVASHEGGPDDEYQIGNFRRHLESMGYATSRMEQTATTGDPDDTYALQEYFTFTVTIN